jgi:hypothetical protein
MGFLSDAAKRGFERAGGGTYVPTWYKSTVAVGGVFIIGVLAYSAITTDRPDPVAPGGSITVGEPIQKDLSSETSKLPLVGGGSVDIPKSALETAEAAALAIWTGDWSKVPVDGEFSDVSATYPNSIVGKASVLNSGSESISFLFSLDEDGNGIWDQDFQVTVISGASGWVYPSYIG